MTLTLPSEMAGHLRYLVIIWACLCYCPTSAVTCNNNTWNMAAKTNCAAICMMVGTESRYTTFYGDSYIFPGVCTYTLVESTDPQNNLTILISKMSCGDEGTSCSRALEITYAGNVVRLIGGGDVVVGNRTYRNEILQVGGIAISPESTFMFVQLDGITIMYGDDSLVIINATSTWEGKLTGLCGKFDQNSQNDLETRDGFTASSGIEFGKSWKVSENPCADFPENENPSKNRIKREQRAKEGCDVITGSEEFAPCRSHLTKSLVAEYFKDCVEGSSACTSEEDCKCMCDSIAAFYQLCCGIGFCDGWRPHSECLKCGIPDV